MRIGRRASRLHDKNVAAAHVLIDLKIKLAVRETLRVRFPHVARQLATNLFCQLGIRISGKDLDAAGCAHIFSESDKNWLGRVDSNQRMPVPKTGALPLGYAPVSVFCLQFLRERKKGKPR